MKKKSDFSVLKEPIPFYLLLTNILLLFLVLYLSYSLVFGEEKNSPYYDVPQIQKTFDATTYDIFPLEDVLN